MDEAHLGTWGRSGVPTKGVAQRLLGDLITEAAGRE